MFRIRNPHSILAALQKRPNAVKAIECQPGRPRDAWQEVVETARAHGIAVTNAQASTANRRRSRSTERVGGNAALIEPPSPVPLSRVLPKPDDTPGLWLALDQVQDPQNLGALFRLAGFFGVRGVIMTKDRSAPVTDTVCDVSAGGVEHVPWTQVSNLVQAFGTIQESGIWIIGTCERSEQTIRDVPRDRSWMLVVGNEGEGLRRLTREKCDQLCALPAAGPVPSLNVATAAAACLTVLSTPAS
jgi:23S rRNA (guanosine2251-2'-O)-methyltransferase